MSPKLIELGSWNLVCC